VNKFIRIILFVELIICFAPVSYLYTLLTIFAARGKMSGFVDGLLYGWDSNFYLSVKYFLVVIVGAMGLVAIISLAIKVISPTRNVITRGKLLVFISLAVFLNIITLISVLNDNSTEIPIIISLILPLIGSLHFMYLGRKYLFLSNKILNG